MKKIQRSSCSAGKTKVANRKVARQIPVRVVPSEFLAELQSAASMIMSREECVALAKELEQLRGSHAVAA